MWGVLFCQGNQAKRKQGRIFKAGETRISASNFDTKDCAILISRIITGTTAIVENRDRYEFLGYSQLK